MTLKESRKKKRRLRKKLISYQLEEFHFLGKGSLELIGLKNVLCEKVEYYCQNDTCYQYLEVITEDGEITGKIANLLRKENKIKPGDILGPYHVIKSRNNKIRFVNPNTTDNPVLKVVKTARLNLFILFMIIFINLATLAMYLL